MSQPLLDQLQPLHADSFGWALACCAWQRSMAEDVLQDSYLRVLDGRAQYGENASLKTWFFAVIKYTASEKIRKDKRRSILNLRLLGGRGNEVAMEEAAPDDPEQSATQSQVSLSLRAALRQLPQRQREVLHLVFYAEMTLDESAQALDISLGSVRTHYHRGKRRLAELLEIEHE